MSTVTTDVSLQQAIAPDHDIARVDEAAALQWLKQGWDDFRAMPWLSLLYGALFAGLCAGLFLLSSGAPWYTIGFLTGLVVIGPFVASGLYAAARDREAGVRPSIGGSVRLLVQRRTYLALFSLMLALVMGAWIRLTALLFAFKFNTLSPPIEAYAALFTSADGWMTLAFFLGSGLALVAAVFVVSAVAIPLILDKDADFIRAMRTSYRAVARNPAAMAIWAALIVSLTFIGVATAFVGLAILFPILGYATWHSYRELVR